MHCAYPILWPVSVENSHQIMLGTSTETCQCRILDPYDPRLKAFTAKKREQAVEASLNSLSKNNTNRYRREINRKYCRNWTT